MAPRNEAAREPEVTELLAEEIAHLLMRADRVEAREVEALVKHLRAERRDGPGARQKEEGS